MINKIDMINKINIIKDMVRAERLPGAFIFEGSPDITEAAAYELARAVVCGDAGYKKEYGGFCGVCLSCRKSGRNTHPDIIVAKPENDGAHSFHIDKVREIIGGIYLSPNESGKKVYIIQSMNNMTPQGQNALLKSLEEPPPFVMFIITAENPDLILETVKSRAVRFSAGNSSGSDSAGAANDPAETDRIIRNIFGNADRLALYQDMLKSFDKSGRAGVLSFYCNLENAARDIIAAKIFADDLSKADFLYFNINNNSSSDNNSDISNLEKYAGNYSLRKIFDLCGKIQEFKADLEYNANTRLNISSFFSAAVQ